MQCPLDKQMDSFRATLKHCAEEKNILPMLTIKRQSLGNFGSSLHAIQNALYQTDRWQIFGGHSMQNLSSNCKRPCTATVNRVKVGITIQEHKFECNGIGIFYRECMKPDFLDTSFLSNLQHRA